MQTMSMTSSKLEVRDGKTVLASVEYRTFCDDNSETTDEAILHAVRDVQRQLVNAGKSESETDNVIQFILPYISDKIRSMKETTTAYRMMNYMY